MSLLFGHGQGRVSGGTPRGLWTLGRKTWGHKRRVNCPISPSVSSSRVTRVRR